ncbi:hypothetical protein PINS_up022643 [Pythium insidiosum]|nr:hypothetical protein PINS_up009611 [Pythium insidiosum]GLE10498.1 hypothetical protein PINS_up022643 [Pythium insidiosum]
MSPTAESSSSPSSSVSTLAAQPHRRRDADEEALQAALRESMAPDFLAEILAAESQRSTVAAASAAASRPLTLTLKSSRDMDREDSEDDDEDADDASSTSGGASSTAHAQTSAATTTTNDDDEEEEDANLHHVLLNFPEYLLVDILYYLDEDAVGNCLMTCHRLRHVAQSEVVFETLCRRIFPAQCPRVALAHRHGRFQLRKFPTWFAMLQQRPRVRHNGFYFLKTYYYKKPELNMWTEIPPGTILQVVYYRYFSFQRDGTVLYAMLFKPPQDAGAVLRRARHHHYVAELDNDVAASTLVKDVWRGTFQVERDEVFVSVPTNHCVVEFRFRVTSRGPTRHSRLVLLEHYAFSEPDRTGWVDYFDTHDEELHFYRHWDL